MKKGFSRLLVLTCFLSVLSSCEKDNDPVVVSPKSPIRVLIANEGQFTYGTASMTALMRDGEVRNDVFRTANDRPLGDVAQSITHHNTYYYVTLNNSRKIEVMNDTDFKSVETILTPDASIPTYMCYMGGDSMAVSEKGSKGRLMIMDLNHGKQREPIRRIIDGVGSGNQMVVMNGKLFLAGATLRVFTLGQVSKSAMRSILGSDGKAISVTGDSKLIVDKNNKIWALTSKKLVCIDPVTESVVKELPFTGITIGMFEGRLEISPDQTKLYFTGRVNSVKGILTVNITDEVAPTQLLFPLTDVRNLYNMAVSREGTIFICDVLFGSIARGLVHEYSVLGEKINSIEAGIFPQYIYFPN
ncbi:MAG: hypothetical protein RL662_607 [Bacteroidota bacterium]|jgi:hypothetical protein